MPDHDPIVMVTVRMTPEEKQRLDEAVRKTSASQNHPYPRVQQLLRSQLMPSEQPIFDRGSQDVGGWDTGQCDCTIAGLQLVLTSFAFPEQYDVFQEGEQVGYLRFRHGKFSARVPDVGGKLVYFYEKESRDGFFQKDERQAFLDAACNAISFEIARPTEPTGGE